MNAQVERLLFIEEPWNESWEEASNLTVGVEEGGPEGD